MITRVTHQSIQRNTLANLQGNLTAMSALQSKLSSGKNITVPSDDPAAASDMLQLRGDQRAISQYQRNTSDADSWLTTVDSALTGSLATLRRVRDITVQGGNGALGTTSREALAAELDGLRSALLAQANTTYMGRTVFAGTSDAGVAFDASYSWTGTGAPVERRVGADATVRVDADGAAVFGTGAGSVFQLIDDIATTLRAGGDPTSSLGAVDTRMDAMLNQLAGVGARHKQVLDTQSALLGDALDVKAHLASVEDIDLAEVILELQTQEVAYKGALGAGAKVLQPTLLDFLR
ncbi:flagellar hook-associated protein FlgL [Cellulomonas edaphi]|uniref:Flagellar hook-associated protein FlgL n=1 Tax=Cellulomonas edaphi TaxID=3053468 RepID=A0ABT7S4H8_9CELL|nr:flagellar hook-associated protein FlgL [Cellulomons edaphi]MDM7830531.1 flagellar hook-associated protein FlgL [Cellulomons edaphi]